MGSLDYVHTVWIMACLDNCVREVTNTYYLRQACILHFKLHILTYPWPDLVREAATDESRVVPASVGGFSAPWPHPLSLNPRTGHPSQPRQPSTT